MSNSLQNKKVVVIGSGFSGLSAACHLAKQGASVTVLEKNGQAGGRARLFEEKGYRFDMGPSWYWMPDVFEKFFNHFIYSGIEQKFYPQRFRQSCHRLYNFMHPTHRIPCTQLHICIIH